MAFATKYSLTWDDVLGVTWDILFQEDLWGGGSTPITPGENPAVISTHQSDKYEPIIGSSVDIQMVYDSNVDDLYTEADQDIKVLLRKEGTNYWIGWLLPGQLTRNFNQPKHYVTLTATDGLGQLKEIKFDDGTDPYFYQQTEIAVISNILQKIGNEWFILDAINIFDDGFSTAASDSPLEQTFVYTEMWWDEVQDEVQDCYTVLSDILRKYGATIRQGQFIWYILRPNSFSLDSIVYRLFTYQGAYSSNSSYTSYTSIGASHYYLYADAELTKKRGVGSCEVTVGNNLRDQIIKNSTFDVQTWNGANPYNWTNNGSTYTRDGNYLKMQTNTSASVPTTYIYTDDIAMHKFTGARITLNFRAECSDIGDPSVPTVARIFLRIRLNSNWYLSTVDNLGQPIDPTWTTTAPTYGGSYPTEGLWFYDLVSAGKLDMTAFEDIAIDLPPLWDEDIEYPQDAQLEIRLHTFNNDVGTATNYLLVDSIRIEPTFGTSLKTEKIYTYDNSLSVNNIRKENLRLADSWIFEEFLTTKNDMFWTTTDAVETDNDTTLWYIRGDGPTEGTGIKIAELLGKQIVEGYSRSIDTINTTIRSANTGTPLITFRDTNFLDSYGYVKSFFPNGISFNIHRNEWNGEWVEVPFVYNDTALDWSSHEYGGLGVITGSSIEINDFTITAGLEVATFETYTAVNLERLRLVITLTDDADSDLPVITLDGDDLSVTWGINYVDYTCDSAGGKVLLLTGTEGQAFELTCNVDFYYLTGI